MRTRSLAWILHAPICPFLADRLMSTISLFSWPSSFMRSRSSSRCAFSSARWCWLAVNTAGQRGGGVEGLLCEDVRPESGACRMPNRIHSSRLLRCCSMLLVCEDADGDRGHYPARDVHGIYRFLEPHNFYKHGYIQTLQHART